MSSDGVYQEFHCQSCPEVEIWEYQAEPSHCGKPMRYGKVLLPAGDPTEIRLHVIRLKRAPEISWQLAGMPLATYELWQLRPTRQHGERFGWLGERATCWEWRMPPGVKIEGGFAVDRETAIKMMWLAYEGGLHAATKIAALGTALPPANP